MIRSKVSFDNDEPNTVKFPVMETFPGMAIEPDASIVRLATPLLTSASEPTVGLMIPVF
jgi:hypothetical protein